MAEEDQLQTNESCSTVPVTILAGGIILVLLLLLGKLQQKVSSHQGNERLLTEAEKKQNQSTNKDVATQVSTIDDISNKCEMKEPINDVKTEEFSNQTKTKSSTAWAATWVGDPVPDESINCRYITELQYCFATGETTRSEKVIRFRNSHVLAKLY